MFKKLFAPHFYLCWFLLPALLAVAASSVLAQTTAFTYQGKLADGGTAATANYDFEFKIFDTAAVGTGSQQGTTVQRLNVAVDSGIFTVSLDFGACASCFDGSVRFLEIAVKQTSGSTFVTLGPRQPITSNPYAIRSLNSATADGLSVACVNCVTSSQIQSVSGSQITGAIPVGSLPTGSANYVQNGTGQQPTSNFNISGSGSAGIFNAATQYNIGGSRVLSNAGSFNLFAGVGAGAANTSGDSNAFFGMEAGKSNTTGCCNAFFGYFAGKSNVTGLANSFFGNEAGEKTTSGFNSFFGNAAGFENTTGSGNTFFGSNAGQGNTTGNSNSFFGTGAGFNNINNNTTGSNNSFFGREAGKNNSAGSNNTFVGFSSGLSNTGENNNTFIGFQANGATGITNATALGAYAVVTASNTMVLGTNTVTVQVPGSLNIVGTFGANIVNATQQFNLNGNRVFQVTGSVGFPNSNVFLGLGAGEANAPNGSNGVRNTFVGNNAGAANTTGFANSFFGALAGAVNVSGTANSFFGRGAGQLNQTGSENTFLGAQAGLSNAVGSRNTYIGSAAGGSDALTNANVFGYRAFATQSDSLILGSISGVNGATANTNVGIGTTSPQAPLHLQRDGIPSDNWQSAQLRISGATDASMQLNLGYDTTSNRGVIQAGQANVAFKDLLLNPSGGNIGIGTP